MSERSATAPNAMTRPSATRVSAEASSSDNAYELIPNHFHDDFMAELVRRLPGDFHKELNQSMTEVSEPVSMYTKPFQVSLGLMVKTRKALRRLVKRNKMKPPMDDNYADLFYASMLFLTHNGPALSHWTARQLDYAAYCLSEKGTLLNGHLVTKLDVEPLFPPVISASLAAKNFAIPAVILSKEGGKMSTGSDEGLDDCPLVFRSNFVAQVNAYHSTVERPATAGEATVQGEGEGDAVITSSSSSSASSSSSSAGAGAGPVALVGEDEQLMNDPHLQALASLPRAKCVSCNSNRQLYCGQCGGVRMANAEEALGERLQLPFDVCLLLHWQESLVKCTGIHTAALCSTGSVSVLPWAKDAWHGVAASLDASRDVLLFPTEDATDAEDFDWEGEGEGEGDGGDEVEERLKCMNLESAATLDAGVGAAGASGSSSEQRQQSKPAHRHRLVVIEASWGYGGGVARSIFEYRQHHGLPPLRCVKLTDIVGKYWKFHEKGHAAVSTIESIAYTAVAAMEQLQEKRRIKEQGASGDGGVVDSSIESSKSLAVAQQLLTLFKLQRFRVLSSIAVARSKPPRALQVQGCGIRAWVGVLIIDDADVGDSLSCPKEKIHRNLVV